MPCVLMVYIFPELSEDPHIQYFKMLFAPKHTALLILFAVKFLKNFMKLTSHMKVLHRTGTWSLEC